MKKSKKIRTSIVAIFLVIVTLIFPIDVLAQSIDISNEHTTESSMGASDAYIANANVQIDETDYYPETANKLEENEYFNNVQDLNSTLDANSSEVEGDPMVFYAQKWLNQEYGNVAGFGEIEENGKTGWDVVYGLLRALQHELGITSLSNNFGNQTSTLYSQNILSRHDGITDKKYAILQFALWCKGYCPGYNVSYNQDTGKVSINAVFDADVERAVIELKEDAGLTNPNGVVTLNVMKALMSMDSFKLLGSSYGAKAEIRSMQQEFNRKYEAYIGLIPCDGVYGRSTNKALIYAYQAEEGLPVGVANGNFGPTTRGCAPNIPYTRDNSAALSYQGNYYTDTQISSFIKLLQFALFVNGFGNGDFSGNYDSGTQQAVKDFQKFYALTVSGIVDISTWMSLFLSSGDPNRMALGADCATILNEAKAKTLYDAGYRYVGRYLTGTFAGGKSKALTIDEEKIILNAGLRFFPIYQDGGTKLEYFTESQGKEDGKIAIETALSLGIPKDTIIYFAVDFDALEYQVNSNIIPYFRAVYNELSQSIYRVGIYAPRNVCTLVAKAGYSCSSFVGDMSTGFSGNLGYPIPDNWAFSQFANLEGDNALGSGDGRIEIDKDAVSGKDQGVDKLDITNYSRVTPESIYFGEKDDAILHGPTINILGTEVNLFELNIGFDVPNSGIYMESCYDHEHEETQIMIGRKVIGESVITTGDREKVGKYKEAYEEVKKTFYAMGQNDREFIRRFNGMKGSLLDKGTKIGFDADTNFFGFITIDANTGKIKEGGLGIVGNVNYSISYPLVVPLYAKIEIKGSVSYGCEFELVASNKIASNGMLEFSVQPNFGVEVNALVARAYGGINGTIDCRLEMPLDTLAHSFEADFNAAVFFEYNAFIWSNRWEWSFYETKLFPKNDLNTTAFSISNDDLEFIEPLPQTSTYALSNEPNVFKNNMQIYCLPQIINLGNDKMMMVYIDDSPNRSAENRTILMYSIFDNNEWSAPQPVADNDTADFQPSIYPDGHGGAHIIWQNATKLFDNTVTLEEMSTNIDLNYTHFNGTSFDNSVAITTNNNDMEMMHKVVSNGDDISVVWVQNSENDTFGLTGTNSVFRKEYTNGKWRDIETVDSDLQVISSIDTSYDGSDNIIAYTTKTGNDTTTIDDLEIFYYDGNNTKRLTDDDHPDYSISLLDNELYWISENSLVQVIDGDIDTKNIVIDNLDITATNVKALKNANGNKAVMWEQNIDNSSTFFVTNYNNSTESFNSVEPLSDSVGSVRGWDACMLSDGQIEMTYGVVQDDDTISLIQKKMNQFCNISVQPAITYSGNISSNGQINILADIYNAGSIPMSQFDVNIYDSDSTLLESLVVDKDLAVGDSAQIEIPYTLPSTISRTDYTIEILPKGESDISLDDNKGIFSFGFADVAINDVQEIRTDNGRQIKVTITNQGFDTANDITIDFCKDGETGAVIDSASATLMPNESTVLTFEIDNSYLDINESLNARTFYISAQTSALESDYGNNSQIINVYPDYNVTVISGVGGTVNGSGTFAYESTTTITAVADEGYKFFAWYEDGNILYNTPETYEIRVNSNRTLKALFVIDSTQPATIKGSVRQLVDLGIGRGNVAPGLVVTLDNNQTTTDDLGEFQFNNILPGAYLLKISGESTIDRTILVCITESETDLGQISVACFDYVKDGVINDQDINVWMQWFNENSQSDNYNIFGDLNGDKYINSRDYVLLYFYKGKTKDDFYLND